MKSAVGTLALSRDAHEIDAVHRRVWVSRFVLGHPHRMAAFVEVVRGRMTGLQSSGG